MCWSLAMEGHCFDNSILIMFLHIQCSSCSTHQKFAAPIYITYIDLEYKWNSMSLHDSIIFPEEPCSGSLRDAPPTGNVLPWRCMERRAQRKAGAALIALSWATARRRPSQWWCWWGSLAVESKPTLSLFLLRPNNIYSQSHRHPWHAGLLLAGLSRKRLVSSPWPGARYAVYARGFTRALAPAVWTCWGARPRDEHKGAPRILFLLAQRLFMLIKELTSKEHY